VKRLSASGSATLLFMAALSACEAPGFLVESHSVEIDASHGDGSCSVGGPLPSLEHCDSDEDCLADIAMLAPSGTLFAVCVVGECVRGSSCVVPARGFPDCVCGAVPIGESGCPGFCLRSEGESAPTCVPACGSP
jgi:hypothetical protein